MSTTTLTADETAILRTLLAAGPVAITEVAAAIERYPRRQLFESDREWRTAMRRWTRRCSEIFAADSGLAERGLIGGPEQARQITEAGRHELARVDDDETAADGGR